MAMLASAAGVVGLVCWIITLIQMFQKEKVILGILGILCGLWAFIWGWMNTAKTGQKNIMLIWTIAWVIYAFAGYKSGMMSFHTSAG